MICIFTIKDDLHALVIQKQLRLKNIRCHLIEVDQLWKNKLSITFDPNHQQLTDREGNLVSIGDIKLIWWRRSSRGQNYTGIKLGAEEKIYMNQEFEATLLGLLLSGFNGRWVSLPEYTYTASNKVLQYSLAHKAGLQIPKTLVSQNPKHIRDFFDENSFEIVVKPLTGSTRVPIFTHKLAKYELPDDGSLGLCPTQYQQYIPGKVHYRVNVFGENIYAFQIIAQEIDWRQDLTIPVSMCDLSHELLVSIKAMLKLLRIEMGIFDFKVNSDDGKPYFFEVNPQGNFLFLEGLTKFPLSEKFTNYLCELLEG